MIDMIRERLDSYLGFDSDLIFNTGDPIIFGGAIRDSIANQEIHDVDILVAPNTAINLKILLESKGYIFQEKLMNRELNNLYHNIRIISEPHTFINRYGRIVQLIRPVATPSLMSKYPNSISKLGPYTQVIYEEVMNLLVTQVDLSCCGVCYDGIDVYEKYRNAILHCQNKVFIINEDGVMKTDRLLHRVDKMKKRGWYKIDEIDERDLTIDHVLKKVYY